MLWILIKRLVRLLIGGPYFTSEELKAARTQIKKAKIQELNRVKKAKIEEFNRVKKIVDDLNGKIKEKIGATNSAYVYKNRIICEYHQYTLPFLSQIEEVLKGENAKLLYKGGEYYDKPPVYLLKDVKVYFDYISA